MLPRHRRAPRARARGSASASIPPTACCGRAPRAISSRGWTRRWATGSSRRGAARRWRSTRSGTTRSGCWRAGCARSGENDGRAADRRAGRSRAARRSTRASGTSQAGYLYDVVDGEAGRRRGLPPEPAARDLAGPSRARRGALGGRRSRRFGGELLTPVGLRSLAPGHPDYKPTYYGDLRTRDAAYHQGTVWAWLIGPYRRRVAAGASRRSRRRPPICSTASTGISARRASARSARSSTPRRRTRRAAASRRPGAWPKSCGVG